VVVSYLVSIDGQTAIQFRNIGFGADIFETVASAITAMSFSKDTLMPGCSFLS
jgi:hypothetical protein